MQQRQQPSLLKEQNSHTALRSQPSTPSRAPRASSKGRFYQLIRAQERDSRGKSIDTDSDSDREQMVSPSSRTAKDTSMSRPRTRSSSSSSVSSAAVATATATAAAAAMARPSPGLLVRATLSTSTRQERKDSGGGGPSVISGPFDVRLPAADKIGPLRPLNGAVLPDAAPTTTEMTAQAVAAKLIATPRRTTAAERERERPYPPSSSQRFHGLSLSRHPSMEPSERAHQHHPYSYANSGSIDASSDRPLSPRLPGPPSEESEGEQPARVSKASKASSFFSLMSTSSLVSEAHEDRNAAAAAAVVSSGGGSGGGSGGAYSGGGGGGGGSGSGSSNTRTTRHPSSSSGLSFKDKLKSAVRSVRRPHSKRSLSSLSASSTIDAQHYASLGSSSSPACKTGGEPSPLSLSPSSPRRAIDIGSRHPSPLYHHGEGDFEGHQQRPSNASERMTPMGQPPQLRRPKTAPSLKLHSSQDTATHVPVETGPKPRRASKSQHPSPLLHSHRAADEGQPAGDGASLVRITASELARMRERPDGRLNAPSSSKKLDTAKSQAGVNATAVRPRPAQARQHALRTTATTPPTFSILQDLPVAEVLQQDVTSSPLRPHTSDAPTPPRFHTTPTSDQRRPKTSGEPASHALLQVDAPLRPASIRARRDSLDADEAVPWREGTGEIAQPCSPPQQRSLPLPGSLPHHPCPPSSPASCPQSVGQSSPEARIQAKHSPHLQHLQVQQQTSNSSSTTTTVNPLLQVLLADDAMSPRASTEDTANDFLETVLFEKPATLSPPGSADDDGQAQGVDHVLDLSHIEDGRNDCCFTRHSILRSRFSVSDSPASEEEDEDEEEEDEEEEEEDDDDEGGEEKNEDDDKMENGNKDDAEAMRSSTDSEARAYKATATSTVTPADDGDGNRFEVTGVTIRQRGPGEAPAIVLDMKVTVNMGVGRPPRVFTGSTELERRDVVTIMSSMALVPRPALSAAPRSLPGDDAGSQDATPTSRVMTRDSSTSISSAGGSGGLRPLLLGSRSSLSFRSPALGFDTISRRGSVSAPPSKTTGMLQAQTQAQAQTQTQAQNSGQEGTVSAINSPRRSMSSPFLMSGSLLAKKH